MPPADADPPPAPPPRADLAPTDPLPSVSDPAFWERAYHDGRDRWELGAPAPPLVRAAAAVPAGERALVLGCGRGHEARLLARAGWRRVVAVDFAPAALAAARALTAAEPADLAARIEWRLQDVFTLGASDPGRFDLVVEHTCFCAIDPSRRAEWAATVARVLRPGGTLVALVSFLRERPGGPPFSSGRDAILAALAASGALAVQHEEVPGDSTEARRDDELLLRATRTV